MLGMIIAIAGQVALAEGVPVNPDANVFLDRDPVLKHQAVRTHDTNRDGRVTTYEYDRAKEFIAVR